MVWTDEKHMSSSLQFEFDPTKLGQTLAFFAFHVRNFDKLKAAKLLYFADKLHLITYGRPIVGDKYFCMDYGPVPTMTLNIINDMISLPAEIRASGNHRKQTILETVESFVRVADVRAQYPKLEPSMSPLNLDALTEAEIEVLTTVVARYGELTPQQLIDAGHGERPWQISDADRRQGSSAEIPWENLLAEAGELTDSLHAYAVELQENREFLDALRVEVK